MAPRLTEGFASLGGLISAELDGATWNCVFGCRSCGACEVFELGRRISIRHEPQMRWCSYLTKGWFVGWRSYVWMNERSVRVPSTGPD
jgi:protein gp37